MKEGLSKTRKGITGRIDELLRYYREIDDDFFDDLEETLIISDIGYETSNKIIEDLRKRVKDEKIGNVDQIKAILKENISQILEKDSKGLDLPSPTVILVVGVNGVGKTTTIGKLANILRSNGKKVLLAAADTFRAAAAEQLEIWANRAGVDIVRHNEGADPAAVVYDAIQAAKSRDRDVLICDTAGRLHNKKNLMNELEKIKRVIDREMPEAHREVLLILDATTGQNAISQASMFKDTVGITGIVLTKLDGTAKGGVVIAIKSQLDIPIYYIGVGEQMDDLQPFDPQAFAEGLFE
ncbi:MAG: signal recognition particle-docking protein FtsY [Clostridiales bacterium]|nr:signal recognition particle-docking protein FtsY [Clostridia bacterium]MDI9512032.1 signal recognition particle-docking protein FtsY [Bacillota bacterium]NLH59512.1 signal recognition particle-docking protein FtsY [Clostridiales bacterium]